MRSFWAQLTDGHRRWLLINAVVIAAVANAVLNALIAWGSAATEDEVPLWAAPLVEGPSTITDTVGTFFVLTFLTTLAITSGVWHELRTGRLNPIALPGRLRRLHDRLPPRRARRGAYLGLFCMLALSVPAILVLVALDFGGLDVGEFVLYKAIFGVVLGAAVTPPIALLAMADREMAVPVEPGT